MPSNPRLLPSGEVRTKSAKELQDDDFGAQVKNHSNRARRFGCLFTENRILTGVTVVILRSSIKRQKQPTQEPITAVAAAVPDAQWSPSRLTLEKKLKT